MGKVSRNVKKRTNASRYNVLQSKNVSKPNLFTRTLCSLKAGPSNRRRGNNDASYDYGEPDPVIDTPPSPPRIVARSRISHRRSHAISTQQGVPAVGSPLQCMAIANEDISENAVVITALEKLPFCCHADLLIMSREQLVDAAVTLNAKLPSALQIDVGPDRSFRDIRESIEILVGIQSVNLPAPKQPRIAPPQVEYRNPTIDFPDFDSAIDSTPPTSPLSRHTCTYSPPKLSPSFNNRLSILTEEEEEDQSRVLAEWPLNRKRDNRRFGLELEASSTPQLKSMGPRFTKANLSPSSPQLQKQQYVPLVKDPKLRLPRSKTIMFSRNAPKPRVTMRAVSNPVPTLHKNSTSSFRQDQRPPRGPVSKQTYRPQMNDSLFHNPRAMLTRTSDRGFRGMNKDTPFKFGGDSDVDMV